MQLISQEGPRGRAEASRWAIVFGCVVCTTGASFMWVYRGLVWYRWLWIDLHCLLQFSPAFAIGCCLCWFLGDAGLVLFFCVTNSWLAQRCASNQFQTSVVHGRNRVHAMISAQARHAYQSPFKLRSEIQFNLPSLHVWKVLGDRKGLYLLLRTCSHYVCPRLVTHASFTWGAPAGQSDSGTDMTAHGVTGLGQPVV